MRPSELKAEDFDQYPLQAKKLAVTNIDLLRRVPLGLLPVLLREIITYDWKFPVERNNLEGQLRYLNSLSPDQLEWKLSAFRRFAPLSELEKLNWVKQPDQFVQSFTALLWSTRQMDSFRAAAETFTRELSTAVPAPLPALSRLGIVVIGQGAADTGEPLFRNLRPHGVHFTQVNPRDGLAMLGDVVAERARTHPLAYGHWYIDGGKNMAGKWDGVACVSYAALEPVRDTLLNKMQKAIRSGNMGPEELRTKLVQMRPEDLTFGGAGTDAVLNWFQVNVLTEGSGTQIFSTTFAQWSAREALRRAEPVTLLLRFAPRQRQQPMNELLSGVHSAAEVDPAGSLIDADMGAYYTWLNQQRLSGADESSFLVWFEEHREAIAIGPSMPRGTESSVRADLKQILAWIG
ncbi:MAG TPA: hypothetical protein VN946_13810 [Terriglobales bacterium]|nr:hypothetical protein [Terriglobales bacterium]